MNKKKQNRLFNVPMGSSFLHCLAETILNSPNWGGHFDQPFLPQDFTIFLPTKRAVRILQNIFFEYCKDKPILLPHIYPLGTVDEEMLFFQTSQEFTIAPAVSGLERDLTLLPLIYKWGKLTGHLQSKTQAIDMAGELGDLFEQMQTEDVSFEALAQIVPNYFNDNWQMTIQFLEIIGRTWPTIKQEAGYLDPTQRWSALLALQSKIWQETPPQKPIIIAGSTGSKPVVSQFLKHTISLPYGIAVLPGLDQDMSNEDWESLEEEHTHAQSGFFHLLQTLDYQREDVLPLPHLPNHKCTSRLAFMKQVLCPAKATQHWDTLSHKDFNLSDVFDKFSLLEAPDAQSEAGVIVLALREILEEKDKKAILVTANRQLARRVKSELERWNIYIDDTAGISLLHHKLGVFLCLILQTIEEGFASVALLSLLKHPFTCVSISRHASLQLSRLLERHILRGPSLLSGVQTIKSEISKLRDNKIKEEIGTFIDNLDTCFIPFTNLENTVNVSTLAKALTQTAENLVNDSSQLWVSDAGQSALETLKELQRSGENITLPKRDWRGIIEYALKQKTVRDAYNHHPRLAIMGLLEARLYDADFVILGGLNEGSWPSVIKASPWLSHPIRMTLGMTSPERRIGLAAHDFMQLAHAPKILLTRAKKENGTTMLPSRWISRLKAFTQGLNSDVQIPEPKYLLDLWNSLHNVETIKAEERPSPCPNIEDRPKSLSVTQIQTLQRNPYEIYASKILRLKRLPPLEQEADAAMRGSFIHKCLELFILKYPQELPDDLVNIFQDIAREESLNYRGGEEILSYWWPRFESLAQWLAVFEKKRRENISNIYVEQKGELKINDHFTLTAKADRIEVLQNGKIAILDYKTGLPPAFGTTDVKKLQNPQMPLEALIARKGGFTDIDAKKIDSLIYVKITGGYPAGELFFKEIDDRFIHDLKQSLSTLITRYQSSDTPYTPYLRPEWVKYKSDYEHLSRKLEWGTGEKEET